MSSQVDSTLDASLVLQYILEIRGRGLILPYEDHELVQNWLKLSQDHTSLLVILSELLPAFFEKSDRPMPLRFVDKKVRQKMREYRLREVPKNL